MIIFYAKKVAIAMLEQVAYTSREEQGVQRVCTSITGEREVNLSLVLSTESQSAIGMNHTKTNYDNNLCVLFCSANVDFNQITSMELVFPPNELEKCIEITILNDDLFEETETFVVSISHSDSTLLTIFQNQAIVTILSEDGKII